MQLDTITIVVPWFGADTAGGAETQARQLAHAIQASGAPVEVWSTVGRDVFAPPGEAHYQHGPGQVEGIAVRRFAVTPPRDDPAPAFVGDAAALVPEWRSFPAHERRLLASLVSSDELLAAVAREAHGRRFVFMPYPFPTSFWGVALAGERAYVLPCLHDEPYARYGTYRWMCRRARRLLVNSPAEGALARRLFDLPHDQVVLCGEGIDLAPRGDGQRFRAQRGLHGPLLLFTGARLGKNAPLLVGYAREYWARRGGPLTLLLTGRDVPVIPAPLRELVQDLGYLSVQEKHDAYAAADVFVTPSTIESFSIALMEAWLQGTPALVNGRCAVTREAAEASGAGLSFDDFGEFAGALDMLLGDGELRRRLGANGRRWVLENCRWDDVARRTIAAVLGDKEKR
jgi:glycosyltransferase involved in cell wall biosynthesis